MLEVPRESYELRVGVKSALWTNELFLARPTPRHVLGGHAATG